MVDVVTLNVLSKKLLPDGARRHHVVIAVITAPFSKVVGDVECSGRRGGVFVIDEVDILYVMLAAVGAVTTNTVRTGRRKDDHIGA